MLEMPEEGSAAARATTEPIETVTKLKGNEPRKRVEKKMVRGRRRTPEMIWEES